MNRMKHLLFVLLLATVAAQAQSAAPAAPAQAEPWQQIKTPPLPPFHPQEPRRVELKNGMVIFLQEDHELPLIDGSIIIRGGGRDVPANKTGMMGIYSETWRTGGTKSKTGDQLDDFLEARAAKVETSADVDSTGVGFSCLKGDFDDVFAVFLDVLQNPEFRDDKIELAKEQIDTAISRRNDTIGSIASRESTKLAWGAENPWARQAEYATVAAVSRKDLLDFHGRYLHPNNVILGITGDFDSRVIEAKLHKIFDGWKRGPAYKPTAAVFKGAKPGLYFIPKENVNQSAIRMVYPVDITRRSPDYFPIEVMNEVLGGGFASRLITDVRSQKGLGYAVGGGVGLAYDHPGIFRLVLGTKSQTTVEGIQALKEEMVGMIQKPPTEEEIKRAKDDILNSFIFHFDSKAKVLRERMAYEFYGYPADFLEQYRAGVEKATAADVARVAQKYLHPEQVATLVVGNARDFGKPLDSLGTVTPIDITIPPPPGQQGGQQAEASGQQEEKPEPAAGSPGPSTTNFEEMSAPTASNAEGKALIEKVADAMGGAANLEKVKATHMTATMISGQGEKTSQIAFDNISELPDRARITMHSPLGDITMVVTPSAAFRLVGDEEQDLNARDRHNVENLTRRDLINVAQHANDPKYIFAADGTEKIGSVEARVLDINADGAHTRWYVDPQSGRVLRSQFERGTDQGPVESVVDYGDWRSVSGVSVPFKRTISEGSNPGAVVDVKQFVVNPPVDPKLFEKPASSGKE